MKVDFAELAAVLEICTGHPAGGGCGADAGAATFLEALFLNLKLGDLRAEVLDLEVVFG